MNTRTRTTLHELSTGDRFYFTGDRKQEVRQVTETVGTGKAHNRMSASGAKMEKYDKVDNGNRSVVFLRHTTAT